MGPDAGNRSLTVTENVIFDSRKLGAWHRRVDIKMKFSCEKMDIFVSSCVRPRVCALVSTHRRRNTCAK